MALFKCRECGASVSDDADKCPCCGHRAQLAEGATTAKRMEKKLDRIGKNMFPSTNGDIEAVRGRVEARAKASEQREIEETERKNKDAERIKQEKRDEKIVKIMDETNSSFEEAEKIVVEEEIAEAEKKQIEEAKKREAAAEKKQIEEAKKREAAEIIKEKKTETEIRIEDARRRMETEKKRLEELRIQKKKKAIINIVLIIFPIIIGAIIGAAIDIEEIEWSMFKMGAVCAILSGIYICINVYYEEYGYWEHSGGGLIFGMFIVGVVIFIVWYIFSVIIYALDYSYSTQKLITILGAAILCGLCGNVVRGLKLLGGSVPKTV